MQTQNLWKLAYDQNLLEAYLESDQNLRSEMLLDADVVPSVLTNTHIVTLLGYTRGDGDVHTNWYPWTAIKRAFGELGFAVEHERLENIERSGEKRIFVCWHDPDSVHLLASSAFRSGDLVLQKVTAVPPNSGFNWSTPYEEAIRDWDWPHLSQYSEMIRDGAPLVCFAARTKQSISPKGAQLKKELGSRFLEIYWGSASFSWEQTLLSKFRGQDFPISALFIGSKWGSGQRGNKLDWERFLEPLELDKEIRLKSIGGIGRTKPSSSAMVSLLGQSRLTPILHARSWRVEEGLQDRFFTTILAGRVGPNDNPGARELLGSSADLFTSEDPEAFVELARTLHKDLELQRTIHEESIRKIQLLANWYVQLPKLLRSLENIAEHEFPDNPAKTHEAKVSNGVETLTIRQSDGHEKRWIVTACDSKYFSSVVGLISSIHDSGMRINGILVADLGLDAWQVSALTQEFGVEVVNFPTNQNGIDVVKTYIFKPILLNRLPQLFPMVQKGDLVLYLDSAFVLGSGIKDFWRVIEEQGVFLIDHSDKTYFGHPGTHIRNIAHFHDEFSELQVHWESEALTAPLLKGGLVGFRVEGKFHVEVMAEVERLMLENAIFGKLQKFEGIPFELRGSTARKILEERMTHLPLVTKRYMGCRHDQFLISYLSQVKGFRFQNAKFWNVDVSKKGASQKNENSPTLDSELNYEFLVSQEKTFVLHRGKVSFGINSKDWIQTYRSLVSGRSKVSELMAGKTVSLVGGGPLGTEAEMPEVITRINKNDLVGFINVFRLDQIAEEKRELYRVDFMVHALSETKEVGGPYSTIKFTNQKPFFVSPYPYLLQKQGGSFREKNGNRPNVENYFRRNNSPIWVPPAQKYLELESRLGSSRPNSGFAAIEWILSMGVKSLHVWGFTFFRGGYQEGYRNQSESEVLDLMQTSGFHNQSNQLTLFSREIINDERLIIENDLYSIVNGWKSENIQKQNEPWLIVGSGPSLSAVNLRLYRSRISVAFNRFYVAAQELNFYPNFLVCIDKNVVDGIIADLPSLLESAIQKFILVRTNSTQPFENHPKVELVEKNQANSPYFGDAATFGIFYFSTLGILDFEIVGCDQNFPTDKEQLKSFENDGETIKIRQGLEDPYHFHADYYPHGFSFSHFRKENHHSSWVNLALESHRRGISIRFLTPSTVAEYFTQDEIVRPKRASSFDLRNLSNAKNTQMPDIWEKLRWGFKNRGLFLFVDACKYGLRKLRPQK